ncbi:hypothetical protein [Cognatilysobacter terrigena]|uniref:hypothetical protein n=1 Tax=Cognatilysobacter terrigena TaxID=2488749 RepID=UPI0014152C57|nr:hypothetical protein [Lysobacter terrigena]
MNTDVRIDNETLVLRVEGDATLGQARATAFEAVMACRDRGLRRLLLDFLDMQLDAPPQYVQRIDIVQEWAEAAPRGLSLALAAPESLLRPDRAGLYVASRLGLDAQVFTDRAAAQRWLSEPAATLVSEKPHERRTPSR